MNTADSTVVTFNPWSAEGRAIAKAAIAAVEASLEPAPPQRVRPRKASPRGVPVAQTHDDAWNASILEAYYRTSRPRETIKQILERHGLDDNYKNVRTAIYGNLLCHGDGRPMRAKPPTEVKDCGGQLCKNCARCIAIQAIRWHRKDHGCGDGLVEVPGVGPVEAS
jgi:hypothetical protein